jgi:MEMO1 family protein
MATGWILRILLCCAFLVSLRGAHLLAAEAEDRLGPREPVLAGAWYPSRPEELRRVVNGFLSGVEGSSPEGEIKGFVVPHAGYIYSGQVAAYAYRMVQGGPFTRVILIGPSHRARFKGVSVDLHSAYKTPLGALPVDRDFGRKILQENASISWLPQAHEQEHSIEIQVPFLQVVLKDARIVPLVMGEQDPPTCEGLAQALIRLVGDDRKTLIVASTDLSHFHAEATARRLDGEFRRHLENYDPRGLARSMAEGSCEACGGGPAVTALLACKGLGADRAVPLRYANSADVGGDRSRVVGYLAAAILKTGRERHRGEPK